MLSTHRAYDPGALAVARSLAAATGAPLLVCPHTRLLVDSNRSPGNRAFLGSAARGLSAADRDALVRRLWAPHRARVLDRVRRRAESDRAVVHVAVHTFTAVLDGRVREVDVGLLYDPARAPERRLCRAWKEALAERAGEWRVRMNRPYRGVSDGLPTWLRTRFQADRYAGVELEVGQALLADPSCRRTVHDALAASLRAALASLAPGPFG